MTISVGVTMFGGEHRSAAPRRSWSPPTRRCTGPRRMAATGSVLTRSPTSRSGPRRRRQTTSGPDPRRAHPRPPQPPQPADPQPRLGRDRALRAAAADDRRRRRAAARRLVHRGGRALGDGPGARPLGRRPGPRAAWHGASAKAPRSRSTSTSPAPRSPTSRCSSSSSAASTKATPTRRAAPSRSPRPRRVNDFEKAGGFADRLTEFGCQVAIDDYGAGFGPFHHLKQMPFDVIKIDGAFVRDMPRSDADQLTVQAIVQIARGPRQDDDRRVRPGRRDDQDAARVRRRHGPGLPPGRAGRRRRGASGLAAPRAPGLQVDGADHRPFLTRALRGEDAELPGHLHCRSCRRRCGRILPSRDGEHVAAGDVDGRPGRDRALEPGARR